MNFQLLQQSSVDCTQFMPRLRLSDKQNMHYITLCNIMNIVDRRLGDTYIMPCTTEIDADRISDIFERLITPTVGLLLLIVSD